MIRAMIWDVDGTLAETEETHRAAFNETFRAFAIDWNWNPATHRRLLAIPDDRARLRAYAEETQTPMDDDVLRRVHADKVHRFTRLVQLGATPLRPGVAEVIAAARSLGIRQAIAAGSQRPQVDILIAATFADLAPTVFNAIATVEETGRLKPAPDVFLLALDRLGLEAGDCVAIEDSEPGLAAARAAGLRVMVTPSVYGGGGDYAGASWVAPDLTGPLPGALACLNGALGRS